MKRILIGLFAGGVIAALAATLGFRFWFQGYLKSEPCRLRLNEAVSKALRAEGEFTYLQPQSLEAIYTDGFTAKNGASFGLLKADQIRAEVRFGFFAKSCTVENLDVTRLRVVLPGSGTRDDSSSTKTETPSNFTLRRISVADFEANWSGGELRKTRLQASPNPGNPAEWLVRGDGGTTRFSTGPGIEWRVEEFDARSRNGEVFLTGARLRTGENGLLKLEGEFSPASKECRATYSAIPVGLLLPPDWRAKLTGKLSGAASLALADGTEIKKGEVILSEGELSALPLLDKIAELTRTDGFRRMNLHKGSARFSGNPAGTMTVTDLLLESSGLLKVEGAFTLREGRIDGTVQVGLVPSALEWIPGAKEKVFTTARDGYLWTPVKLSGPATHPVEDLSTRLAAAAVHQTIDSTKESVRKNAQGVLDLVAPLVPLVPEKLPNLPLLGP